MNTKAIWLAGLLSAFPLTGMSIENIEGSFYGTIGTGYSDNEPLNDFHKTDGSNIGHNNPSEVSFGYHILKDIALEASLVLPGLSQDDERPDITQLRINGLYFFSDEALKPYAAVGLGHEEMTIPNDKDESSYILSAGLGLQYDFDSNWFGRVEGRLDSQQEEEFEHAIYMLEVGYRFDLNSTKRVIKKVMPLTDTDNDGVTNDMDMCPGTAANKAVDKKGCVLVLDDDKDGVVNGQDQCEQTKANTKVDDKGCAIVLVSNDDDMDGVVNDKDQCQDTEAGMKVDEIGCSVFKGTLDGVKFNSGSSVLTANSKVILNKVAAQLKKYPTIKVNVSAYTDSMGSEILNQKLSEARAASTRIYLISQGVKASNLVAEGHGEDNAIATNDTAAGREKNRRVEFSIIK